MGLHHSDFFLTFSPNVITQYDVIFEQFERHLNDLNNTL